MSLRLSILLLFLLLNAGLVVAQEDESCAADDLNARINTLISTYQEQQANQIDDNAAYESASALTVAINGLLDACAPVATVEDAGRTDLGSGTLDDPFAFGSQVDTGKGFTLRITGVTRPADTIIQNINPFNDAPLPDENYIILRLEVLCHADRIRCDTSYLHYEMVGDRGLIYTFPYLVYPNRLNLRVLGGQRAEGDLVFRIKRNDSNLRLIFRPDLFRDTMIVLAGELSLENRILATANADLNVRRGPGTDYPVDAGLSEGEQVFVVGRTADSLWLQTGDGWISRDILTLDGDPETLPVTFQQ